MIGRDLVEALMPPWLLAAARRAAGRGVQLEPVRSMNWREASAQTSGYQASVILDRVTQATRAVVSGAAAAERDGVTFTRPEIRFPLLAALYRSALANDGKLEVIDFGGSLGSLYWTYRSLLSGIDIVRWTVVEQPAFVRAGRAEFATAPLAFEERLEDVRVETKKPIAIASSVLQYMEQPYQVLEQLAATRATMLAIDRTPLTVEHEDQLYVQRVSSRIYPASYPSWALSRPKLEAALVQRWRQLVDFSTDEGTVRAGDGKQVEYRGYLLERASST